MDMQLVAIKPNLIIAVGDLSSKKIQLLDQYLLPQYETKQPMPNGVAYINHSERSNVIIGQNQIGFGIDGVSLTNSYSSRWLEHAKKIADGLLLDSTCVAHEFQLMGTVDAYPPGAKSASSHSIQKFTPIRNQKFKEKIGVAPIAAGIRYVFKKDKLIWDCAIEPLLSDLSKFVLSANVKIDQGSYSFDDVFECLDGCIRFFNEDWFSFVKDEILI